MKKFDVDWMRLALRLLVKQSHIDRMIHAFHLNGFKELAQLYCDISNLYIDLVEKYGVNTYSQYKLGGYLVQMYDALKPECDFDDFCKIIYIPTDIKGLYKLPEVD
ncbi:MAG TPA: hypothetical protein DC024_10360 [Clostridiales bacterium]|jgi:hypothetical protein|nr:hypothetical protein [Clostridiales bacterium]